MHKIDPNYEKSIFSHDRRVHMVRQAHHERNFFPAHPEPVEGRASAVQSPIPALQESLKNQSTIAIFYPPSSILNHFDTSFSSVACPSIAGPPY
jgi:hypothetical protein